MNVYMVRADGEDRLFLADTMIGAIEKDFAICQIENADDQEFTREYYDNLLEQVVCIGELYGAEKKP